MAHERTIPELISTAKALQQKAEHAAEKAEQFYKSLGLTLKELKERKPKGITWPAFVAKHFTIGKTRADELIRIASGTTTVEATKEAARQRQAKSRTGRDVTSIPARATQPSSRSPVPIAAKAPADFPVTVERWTDGTFLIHDGKRIAKMRREMIRRKDADGSIVISHRPPDDQWKPLVPGVRVTTGGSGCARHDIKVTFDPPPPLRPAPILDPDVVDEEQTAEERWQNSLANLCGDILARPASWNRNMPGWREFECPSHIKTLVDEAATAFASLAEKLREPALLEIAKERS